MRTRLLLPGVLCRHMGRYKARSTKAMRAAQRSLGVDSAEQLERMQQMQKAKLARGDTSRPFTVESLGRPADSFVPGQGSVSERVRSEVTNVKAAGDIKKDLGGKWSRREFSREAAHIYVRFNEAYARGALGELRELLVPDMYARVRRRLEKRQKAGDRRKLEWKGEVVKSKILTIRHIPAADIGMRFAHVAVRFDTRQRLLVLDSAGEVERETPQKEVQETWVLERATSNENGRWRWLATLPLEPGELSLFQMQQQQQQ